MFQTIRCWWRQIWCLHSDRELTGIGRGVENYERYGMYYCPSCDKVWRSRRLPDSVERRMPW